MLSSDFPCGLQLTYENCRFYLDLAWQFFFVKVTAQCCINKPCIHFFKGFYHCRIWTPFLLHLACNAPRFQILNHFILVYHPMDYTTMGDICIVSTLIFKRV